MDHAKVFDRIYKDNMWGNGSGPGSSEENTRDYRQFLQKFLKTNRIKSAVDLGCGDWQFSKHIDWTGIEYLGIDVSTVALKSASAFTASGIRFQRLNAVTDELPKADLLLAKDVLQHLSNADILRILPKLKTFRFALITNGFHPREMPRLNVDIDPGGWRPVDLAKPPFSLPGNYIYWYHGDEPKRIFLWSNPDGD